MVQQGKKYQKHEGTVIAYHRYVQSVISERLNSLSLGPGKTPCLLSKIFLPISLIFLTVGLLIICLRPYHLYLVGVWPRFVGPFFVILFLVSFGLSVLFFDLANRRSNKYRRKLKFKGHGLYGTKVVHESMLDREKLIKDDFKSGTSPHKPKTHRTRRYQPRSTDPSGNERRERVREYEAREQERPPISYKPRPEGRKSETIPPDVKPQISREKPPITHAKPTREPRRMDPRAEYSYGMEVPRDREKYESGSKVQAPKAPSRYAIPPRAPSSYAEQPQAASRYAVQPEKFYDDHSIDVQPAEEHHLVSRKYIASSKKSSALYPDEDMPMVTTSTPGYQIHFTTDNEDSIV